MVIVQSIIWRRLDQPGFESSQLLSGPSSWNLIGTAVFIHEQKPCRLDYRIECDRNWQTRSGRVEGWVGKEIIDIDVKADGRGNWQLNGEASPEVAGCIDLDLNFSPSTNLLPIRRLRLEVGQETPVDTAWLRFPSFKLERLDQIYRRLEVDAYRYESAGGSFTADLRINDDGYVLDYPNLWHAEAVA
jgi:hypothetical protein